MKVEGNITLETLSIQIARSLRFFMISFGSFFLFAFLLGPPVLLSLPFGPSDCVANALVPICWPLSAALALFAKSPADDEIVPSGIIELSEGNTSALPPPPEFSNAVIKNSGFVYFIGILVVSNEYY